MFIDFSMNVKGCVPSLARSGVLLVASLLLGNASLASAERESFPIGTQIVGLEGGRAFLRIDLPIATLEERQAEIGEAILVLRTSWATESTCLMITPFDFNTESVAAGDLVPHASSAILSRRTCPVFRGSGRGTFTVSVRALISSILDGQYGGRSLLIGLAHGPDASSRLPAAALEDLDQDWEATLDVFY